MSMTTENKPYEMPETESGMVAEPMAEYGMDINTLKLEAIEQLMMIVTEKHYNIIYSIKNECSIEIAAIWDCRQAPEKLQQAL